LVRWVAGTVVPALIEGKEPRGLALQVSAEAHFGAAGESRSRSSTACRISSRHSTTSSATSLGRTMTECTS
jgi:hypothetical protein